MVRHHFFAATLVGVLALPAIALAAEANASGGTTRCGGLLCDLYYAGKPAPAPGQPEPPDPTRLPCRDFLCAAFGGRTPDPTPPPVEPAAAPVVAKLAPTTRRASRKNRAVATKSAANTVKPEDPAK